jgi:hypothetical protein
VTGVALFIAAPTGTCRLALRRYGTGGGDGEHYHDATAVIDENAPVGARKPDGTRQSWVTDKRVPPDDSRWPSACRCGVPFLPDDRRQVNELDWYEGGGRRFTWGIGSWDGPPGAMIRAPWRDYDGRPPAWTIFLPNGSSWNTNDRAAGAGAGSQLGPYWDVAGDAPLITVSPSIDDRDPARPWHGWIRGGFLELA